MKYFFSLVIFLACTFNVRAQIFKDGAMQLERIGKIEGKSFGSPLPAPAEIGGVIIQVHDPPNSATYKRLIYHYNATRGGELRLLCSDDSKEFTDRGEILNGGMMAFKDGVYVSSQDSKHHDIQSVWKCGYDSKITRITGLDNVLHLNTLNSGKKDVKCYALKLPFPSNEDGKYYILGWYFEVSTGRFLDPGMYKLDTKTQEAVEVFSLPSPNLPWGSANGGGWWTDGNTAVLQTLQPTTNISQVMRCSPPKFCSTIFIYGGLYNGEQVGVGATYDLAWDDAYDISYKFGDKARLLYCNYTCYTYLKSEDVASIGTLVSAPNNVPYSDPCTTVIAGTWIVDATAVLVCRGEAPRPFIRGGVFPGDSTPSKYYYANSEDRKGAYIFQACPGQQFGSEFCWIVWKASIAPVIVVSPYQTRSRRR